MRRLQFLSLSIFFFLLLLLFTARFPPTVLAANCDVLSVSPNTIQVGQKTTDITITTIGSCFTQSGTNYQVQVTPVSVPVPGAENIIPIKSLTDKTVVFSFSNTAKYERFNATICQQVSGIGCMRTTSTQFTVGAPIESGNSAPIFNENDQKKKTFTPNEEGTFLVKNIVSGGRYRIYFDMGSSDQDVQVVGETYSRQGLKEGQSDYFVADQSGDLEFKVNFNGIDNFGEHPFCIGKYASAQGEPEDQNACIQLTVTSTPVLNYTSPNVCFVEEGTPISFTASDLMPNTQYEVYYGSGSSEDGYVGGKSVIDEAGFTTGSNEKTKEFPITPQRVQKGEWVCINVVGSSVSDSVRNCRAFDVLDPTKDDSSARECDKTGSPTPTQPPPLPPCADGYITYGPNSTEQKPQIIGCGAINTGLGFPVSTNPAEFVGDIFTFLLSISGGILLLLIMYSGYQMVTSRGEPEKLQAARERITSAIIGFMFLIFSLVILESIGVNVLRIPGFIGQDDSYDNVEALRANRPDIVVPTKAPARSAWWEIWKSSGAEVPKDPITCGNFGSEPCKTDRKTTNDGCLPEYAYSSATKKCQFRDPLDCGLPNKKACKNDRKKTNNGCISGYHLNPGNGNCERDGVRG